MQSVLLVDEEEDKAGVRRKIGARENGIAEEFVSLLEDGGASLPGGLSPNRNDVAGDDFEIGVRKFLLREDVEKDLTNDVLSGMSRLLLEEGICRWRRSIGRSGRRSRRR